VSEIFFVIIENGIPLEKAIPKVRFRLIPMKFKNEFITKRVKHSQGQAKGKKATSFIGI